MSVLHMGLTIAGCRDLVCDQHRGDPAVVLANRPGAVYFGQLTGPTHQVFHRGGSDADLVDSSVLGPCAVTVMLRTGLFPHCRSRLRARTPHTMALFTSLAHSFMNSLNEEQ